jgi:hypothetical protein
MRVCLLRVEKMRRIHQQKLKNCVLLENKLNRSHEKHIGLPLVPLVNKSRAPIFYPMTHAVEQSHVIECPPPFVLGILLGLSPSLSALA